MNKYDLRKVRSLLKKGSKVSSAKAELDDEYILVSGFVSHKLLSKLLEKYLIFLSTKGHLVIHEKL